MNTIKKYITPILFSYLAVLLLVHILPINGKESVLNNNYILSIRLDYLGHAIMFGVLTILGLIYVKKKRKSISYSVIAFSLFTLLLVAVSMEGLQYVISWRSFNVNDLVANGVGVGLAYVIFILIINSLNFEF